MTVVVEITQINMQISKCKKCFHCDRLGNTSKVCQCRSFTAAIQVDQQVHSVVHLNSKENPEAEIPPIYPIVQLPEFSRKLKLMVDSASPISFVNLLTWHDLDCLKLLPTSRILGAFEGQLILPVGYFN